VPKRGEDHPPIEQTPGHVNACGDLRRRRGRAAAWRSTGAALPRSRRVPEGAYVAMGHSVWVILNALATGEVMAN